MAFSGGKRHLESSTAAPHISEFYNDSVVFLTGGSGFLGKALLIKILRTCYSVHTVYVMMRVKKQQSSEERFAAWLENPVHNHGPNLNIKVKLANHCLGVWRITSRSTRTTEKAYLHYRRHVNATVGNQCGRSATAASWSKHCHSCGRHGSVRRGCACCRQFEHTRHSADHADVQGNEKIKGLHDY